MLLFLTLLIAGIALVAIGAAVDGMFYLMSIGVLLLIVDLLYLAARSIWRSTRPPAR
jgi:NADH:ubiquinone oxidoreductase subunit K